MSTGEVPWSPKWIAGDHGLKGWRDADNPWQARFDTPSALCEDKSGNVVIADTYNHSIRVFDMKTHAVRTLAGNGTSGYAEGKGQQASFYWPLGIASDDDGNVFVSDSNNNRIRRVNKDGMTSLIAGNGQPGSKDGACHEAQFFFPRSLVHVNGRLYVTDGYSERIRCVDLKSQTVSTIAGSTEGFRDGLLAEALFNFPTGMCVDKQSRLIIADAGNSRIRRVDLSAGTVTTIAGCGEENSRDGPALQAEFTEPMSVCCAPSGDILITDLGKLRVLSGMFEISADELSSVWPESRLLPMPLLRVIAGYAEDAGTVSSTDIDYRCAVFTRDGRCIAMDETRVLVLWQGIPEYCSKCNSVHSW